MAYGYGYGTFGHYNAPFYRKSFGGYCYGLGCYNSLGFRTIWLCLKNMVNTALDMWVLEHLIAVNRVIGVVVK